MHFLQLLMFIDGVPRNKIASLLPQDDLALQFLGRISEKAINTYWYSFALIHTGVSLSSDRSFFR
jgi:hypothetical protein